MFNFDQQDQGFTFISLVVDCLRETFEKNIEEVLGRGVEKK
jgi:hypothetical protein